MKEMMEKVGTGMEGGKKKPEPWWWNPPRVSWTIRIGTWDQARPRHQPLGFRTAARRVVRGDPDEMLEAGLPVRRGFLEYTLSEP